MIHAACVGTVEIMKLLVESGRSITEVGYIGLSKVQGNRLTSNVIGAAVYYGNNEVLKYLLTLCDDR